MNRTGWVALHGQIVGNVEDYEVVYYWDGVYHLNKESAVLSGFAYSESDDFNVGHVIDGSLTWFGWMDKQFTDAEDYVEPAEQHGWTIAVGGDAA